MGTPIHAASVPTDHLQSADAEIEKSTSCAAAVSLTLRGSTVVGQGGGGGTASWVTTIIRPPTSTLPERAGPSLAATRNVPVAEPAPERVVSAIHDVPVDTDHVQSADAETAKLTISPLAFTRTLAGSTAAGHGEATGAGAASWETEMVCPATLMLPERANPTLAPTTNAPLTDPTPNRVSSAIHDMPVETDHLQSAGAETRKLTVSPLAFTRTLPGSTDAGHGPGSVVGNGESGIGFGAGTGDGVGTGTGDGPGAGPGIGLGTGSTGAGGGVGSASPASCVTTSASCAMRMRPWRL